MSPPDVLCETFTNKYAVTATRDHSNSPHDGSNYMGWGLLDHWFMDEGLTEIPIQ